MTDKQRINHILEIIKEAIETFDDVDFTTFSNENIYQRTAERLIEIIGEASANVTEQTKNECQNIPWRIMKGMRNILIHEYFKTDVETVWNTIKFDIPSLEQPLLNVLKNLKNN